MTRFPRLKAAVTAAFLFLCLVTFVAIVIGNWMRSTQDYGNVRPDPAFLCPKGVTGQLAQDSQCLPNP